MKKTGITLTVLGVLLLAGTIIWMTVGLNVLLVIPDGQDMTAYYEGEATFYVNPVTSEPLPAGQEMILPLEVSRHIFTIDDETTSENIVFEEDLTATMGIQKSERSSVFVLDRKDSMNVASDLAYDWFESNQVDRTGSYYPLFPMDTTADRTYQVWKGDIGRGADAVYQEDMTSNGIELMVFTGEFTGEETVDDYPEAMGLPSSVPFSAIATRLTAAGFDVEAFMSQAVPRMSEEDQLAVATVTQAEIPLQYYMDFYQKAGIEPVTGMPMDIVETVETTSMSPDLTVLLPLFNAMMKYKDDAVVGPYVQKLAALQSSLSNAEPSKVVSLRYHSTDESLSELAGIATDNLDKIKLARTYIPIGGFALGSLMLAIGIILLFAKNRGQVA